MTSADQDWI